MRAWYQGRRVWVQPGLPCIMWPEPLVQGRQLCVGLDAGRMGGSSLNLPRGGVFWYSPLCNVQFRRLMPRIAWEGKTIATLHHGEGLGFTSIVRSNASREGDTSSPGGVCGRMKWSYVGRDRADAFCSDSAPMILPYEWQLPDGHTVKVDDPNKKGRLG